MIPEDNIQRLLPFPDLPGPIPGSRVSDYFMLVTGWFRGRWNWRECPRRVAIQRMPLAAIMGMISWQTEPSEGHIPAGFRPK